MRTSDVALYFGVTPQTIRRWINTFPQFFTEAAKTSSGRRIELTDEDLLLLATINDLSRRNYGLKDIRRNLEQGFRVDGIEISAADIPSRPSSLPDPSLVKTLKTAQEELEKLKSLLEKTQAENFEMRQKIEEMQYRLGAAEGKVELLQTQLAQRN